MGLSNKQRHSHRIRTGRPEYVYNIYMKCKLRLFKSTFLQWSSRAIKTGHAYTANGGQKVYPHPTLGSFDHRLCTRCGWCMRTHRKHVRISHKMKIILFLAARTTNHWMGSHFCGHNSSSSVDNGHTMAHIPLTNHLVFAFNAQLGIPKTAGVSNKTNEKNK